MFNLTTFIQHSFESPSHSSQRRKRNKRNLSWKTVVKVSLFADEIIIMKMLKTLPMNSRAHQ